MNTRRLASKRLASHRQSPLTSSLRSWARGLEEVCLVEQDLLHCCHLRLTMIFGYRRSFSIGCLSAPTILEDDGVQDLTLHVPRLRATFCLTTAQLVLGRGMEARL